MSLKVEVKIKQDHLNWWNSANR